MRGIFLGIALVAASAGAAHAQWQTTVEDDLFSDNKTAVMLGIGSGNWSLYAKCTGTDDVSLAYIEKGDPGDLKSHALVGTIVIKADNGTRWESATSVYPHNDSYLGFAFDNAETVTDVIRDLGKASGKILIGLDLILADTPSTITLSARGSSKATKQFLDACGLNS